MNTKLFYALVILGIAVAVYLTIAKYETSILACPDTGVINCASVITSQYSEIIGIPTSILGIFLFALAPLFILRYGDTGKFLWSVAGAGAVIYSVTAMALLGLICIYCSTMDILILAIITVAYYKKKSA